MALLNERSAEELNPLLAAAAATLILAALLLLELKSPEETEEEEAKARPTTTTEAIVLKMRAVRFCVLVVVAGLWKVKILSFCT